MALSSSTPNGAPRGNFSGLLRAASCRRRASRARLAGSAAANSPACCVAREFVPNIEPVARGRRWWQRAYGPTLCQATVVVRPMRQHSCHRAAAWSRRRAGRRQWTASWALADAPRGRRGDPRAPSSLSIAVDQRACGRPRRGSVAAVLPHWSHDDGRLPEGRLIRPRPPPAEGHGREAWCQQRSGTAGGRWEPRLPSHPASSLDPHALVRTAFDHSEADRRGLWGTRRGRTPSGEYL